MRFLLVLFFFISSWSWGQTVFTSPLTLYWPAIFTTDLEEINSTIIFDDSKITIKSDTKWGMHIQTLLVSLTEETDSSFIFYCTSPDNVFPTNMVIPHQEVIEIIDFYQLSATGEEIQVRFHVDLLDNGQKDNPVRIFSASRTGAVFINLQ